MQLVFRSPPVMVALAAVALAASAWVNAASAQSVEEIDAYLLASEEPAEGFALARSQVAEGALLQGLATLDRVLAAKPKDKQARLLRARILCLIDDKVGAAVEFGRLRQRDYARTQWDAALAACSADRGSGGPDR